jgi:hypothetical protein
MLVYQLRISRLVTGEDSVYYRMVRVYDHDCALDAD